MYCTDEYSMSVYETTRFLLFSPEVPALIYYSHITAVVVTLLLSVFIIAKSRTLAAKTLFAISLAFSALSVLDILLWTQIHVGTVMILWSFWLTLFTLIFCLSFYFLYTFIKKQDLRLRYKLAFVLLVVLVEILSITALNLEYFDLAWCEAGEGVTMLNTVFGFSFVVFIASLFFGINETRKIINKEERHAALLATIGVGSFLLIFSAATYMASLFNFLSDNGSFEFLVEQYGYFGMTIFIGFLAYIIVQYNAFQVKLVATNALVFSLIVLVGSQFTYANSTTTTLVLTSVTLVLTCVAGYYLIRAVRREIEQRKRNEELAKKLAKANKRLRELDKMKSEFVSIASHQLRSPLTSIRGYASMVLDGSFGKVPQKAQEAIERIADSSATMASSVEDYLNVSRIEAGNMKYELVDFNLKDEASKVVDDKRREAVRKGLLLTFKSDVVNHGIVNADLGKTRQILHNLINNAIKYTPKGSIGVHVEDDPVKKHLHVHITDTGVGLSPTDIEGLFGKFERAKGAAGVNATGTGLGLFIARKMANDMQGDITVTSPGPGHGSTFTLTLPLQM